MVMTQLTLEQAWDIIQRSSNSTTNSVNNPSSFEHERLRILQWNARSLNEEKLACLINDILASHSSNVLCISELGHRRDIPGYRCAIASDLDTQMGIFVDPEFTTEPIDHPRLSMHSAGIMGQGVKLHGKSGVFIILHIYIHPDASEATRSAYWRQIQPLCNELKETPLLICGDLNTKSPLLCPAHIGGMTHEYFERFINDNDFEIINTGLPTRGNNALDAGLANQLAAPIINSWTPIIEESSDHDPCFIDTAFQMPQLVSRRKGLKPFSYINIPLSVKAILSWLKDRTQRPDGILDLTRLGDAIQNNLITSTSWHPVVSFWNSDLSKLKRQRNIAYRRRHESSEANERYLNLDKSFKHMFKKARRTFQRAEVERICREDPTGSNAWTICKTLQPDMRTRRKKVWRTQTIPAQEQVTHIAEKFSSISNDPVLNPTQEELDRYNTQIATARTAANTEPITTQEILRAVKQTRSKGAAGADRVSPRYLKQACQFPMFLNAFKACINIAFKKGEFPDEWKTAKVIPLPKASPDEFRPISLLSSIGKIFEKILEQRIRESIHDKLSPIQHGCRAGHSTTQALCRFAHSNGMATKQNLKFGAVAFDFSKAYDRVPKARLIGKLVDLDVPGPLIVMVDNWLTNRKIIVHYRRAQSIPFATPHGIPQGSALSVLLWLIYINDLGTRLDNERSNLYVDDSLIWAAARSKRQTVAALQAQANILADWADENKVKINWDKTQFIYNTSSRSDPALVIRNKTILPKTSLKYLGVDFLSSNEFQSLTYDFKAIGADIRRRAAVVHRLNRFQFPSKVIRKFTEGFVHAKLRYISPLIGGEHVSALEPLRKSYQAAIRTELGAFRSTPIPLLYLGAQRPTLDELIQRDTARLVLRSIAQNSLLGKEYLEWDGEGTGYSPLGAAHTALYGINHDNPSIIPIRPISLRIRDAILKCQFHFTYTKEEAMVLHSNHLLIQEACLSLWCDGSFINTSGISGAAALLYDSEDQLIGVQQDVKPNTSSSYEGELQALLIGLRMIRNRGPTRQTIRIYSDSKSVITHIHAVGLRYRAEDELIRECAIILARLAETNTVALHWIPGHRNIGFSEIVDQAAKAALSLDIEENAEVSLRLSTFNLLITQRMQANSTSQLLPKIKESQFDGYPNRAPFRRMTPKDLVLGPIYRMRTGHTYCLQHLFNLGMVSDTNCRLCSANIVETVEHQLLHCPALSQVLQEFRHWISLLEHTGGLRFAMWNQPRRLEGFVVKALKAGAHL
jgi:ribonuclease HI